MRFEVVREREKESFGWKHTPHCVFHVIFFR